MDAARALIDKVEAGRILTREDAEAFMRELLSGQIDTPEIVRMLEALNRRPFDFHELAGFASMMREQAALVFSAGVSRPKNLLDTCGTGGDASNTFNISTASAIVAAAAGAFVAKHGNRSVSSRSGSADVLEALGVRIDLPLLRSGQAIREVGFGFLFAPLAHSATRHAFPARRQIAKRTVFNLLGPLTNPAGAELHLLGVYSNEVVNLTATTLVELGVERALVVHGAGGLDEISLAGETLVAEIQAGQVRHYSVTPEDFGMQRAPVEALHGGSPAENAAFIRRIFEGESGAKRDVVVANAAAALFVSSLASDFRSAAEVAASTIDSGAAMAKLEQLIEFTNEKGQLASNLSS
jgi:anthranilate phosphoribosyltransferase